MLKADKCLLLAKIESTYGTDAAPTKTANAIFATNIKISGDWKKSERLALSPNWGKYAPVVTGQGVKVTFETELHPSADGSAAPFLGPLFQACGMTETLGAPTVTYSAVLQYPAAKSVTLWFYINGIVHKVTGCIGTFKIDLAVKEICNVSFEFTGLYSEPADLTFVTDPTFPATSPFVFKDVTVNYDSITALIGTAIGIDKGNQIAMRDDWTSATGTKGYYIQDFETKITLDPETEPMATVNFWNRLATQEQGALSITINNGSRDLSLQFENTYIDTTDYGDKKGILTSPITLVSKPKVDDAIHTPFVMVFS
jgi:hypothetical protein